MRELQINELISSQFIKIAPETGIYDIARAMAAAEASCAIVMQDQAATGIITEGDIIRAIAHSSEATATMQATANELMSAPLSCISAQQNLYDNSVTDIISRYTHVPICDDAGNVLGVVDRQAITAEYFLAMEVQNEKLEYAIRERTIGLEQANAELQALSLEDALMGVGNRRAMEIDLQHTHAGALRYGHSYCVALADVDYFKKYNDLYGHAAGDEVLRLVAKTLKESARKTDRIYRYGGEEILLLLPDTDTSGGLIFMQRALQELASQGIPHAESPFGFLTISAGIAGSSVEGKSLPCWRDVVEQADQALYASKNADRNTASIAA